MNHYLIFTNYAYFIAKYVNNKKLAKIIAVVCIDIWPDFLLQLFDSLKLSSLFEPQYNVYRDAL